VRDHVARGGRRSWPGWAGHLRPSPVPQTHERTAETEVDVHDPCVILRGVTTKTALFMMRWSFFGRAVHRRRCRRAGGVPGSTRLRVRAVGRVRVDKIGYDNLKPAVSRVMCGRTRTGTQRWVALRSYYQLDPFYCLPRHEGCHEKGGRSSRDQSADKVAISAVSGCNRDHLTREAIASSSRRSRRRTDHRTSVRHRGIAQRNRASPATRTVSSRATAPLCDTTPDPNVSISTRGYSR
jgi:hypothetical protein